jgi:hypothetical protein
MHDLLQITMWESARVELILSERRGCLAGNQLESSWFPAVDGWRVPISIQLVPELNKMLTLLPFWTNFFCQLCGFYCSPKFLDTRTTTKINNCYPVHSKLHSNQQHSKNSRKRRKQTNKYIGMQFRMHSNSELECNYENSSKHTKTIANNQKRSPKRSQTDTL